MLLGECPQGGDVVRIPVEQLDEVEDVAPLAAAEAAEAFDLAFAPKDPEAGRVLLVEGTERESPTTRLLM